MKATTHQNTQTRQSSAVFGRDNQQEMFSERLGVGEFEPVEASAQFMSVALDDSWIEKIRVELEAFNTNEEAVLRFMRQLTDAERAEFLADPELIELLLTALNSEELSIAFLYLKVPLAQKIAWLIEEGASDKLLLQSIYFAPITEVEALASNFRILRKLQSTLDEDAYDQVKDYLAQSTSPSPLEGPEAATPEERSQAKLAAASLGGNENQQHIATLMRNEGASYRERAPFGPGVPTRAMQRQRAQKGSAALEGLGLSGEEFAAQRQDFINYFRKEALIAAHNTLNLSEAYYTVMGRELMSNPHQMRKMGTQMRPFRKAFKAQQDFEIQLQQSRATSQEASIENQRLTNRTKEERDKVAETHPILGDSSVTNHELATTGVASLPGTLLEATYAHIDHIETVRKNLESDPNYVWELAPIVNLTALYTGTLADPALMKLVTREQEKRTESVGAMLLMYVSLVTGMVSIATGGLPGILFGAIGSIAGAFQTVEEYRKYMRDSAAAGVDHREEMAITDADPSAIGLGFTIALTVFDLGAAAAAFRTLGKGLKAVRSGEQSVEEAMQQFRNDSTIQHHAEAGRLDTEEVLAQAERHFDEATAGSIEGHTAGAIRNVNKGIDGSTLGTNNCTNCAIATDLRLQGIQSTAMPKPIKLDPITNKPIEYVDEPVSVAFLADYFGTKWDKTYIQQLNRLKEGKRGIIYGVHKETGLGHVFNVVNQNGVIRYLDGQTGTVADITKWKNLHFLPTN